MSDDGGARSDRAGPPRFFALAALPSGTLLAGTCARGMARSGDGSSTWSAPARPPGPGAVHSFALSPDGSLVAATSLGVHASDDEGLSWAPRGLAATSVYAVLPLGATLLAGTDGHGVLRSVDGGRTWGTLPGQPRDQIVYRLVATRSGALLAATQDGIWRFGGGDDRPWAHVLPHEATYALVELPDGHLIAGTSGGGAAWSDDGGSTWRRDGTGLPDPTVHVLVDAGGGRVLAGTGAGVALSTDGGHTWSRVGEGLRHHRVFSLAVTPTGDIIAGSYDGVWTLPVGSTPWTALDTGLGGDAFSMSVGPRGEAFAGTTAGLLRSSDAGASWTAADVGLDGALCHDVLQATDGRWVAATDQGVFSSDDAVHWSRTGLSGQRARCLLESTPDHILVGTMGGGLFRGDGQRWEPVDVGVAHRSIFDLLAIGDDTVLAAVGDVQDGRKTGTVVRSPDGGATWTAADVEPVTCYRLATTSTGTVFVGAQRCRILRSRDGGRSWDALRAGPGPEVKLYALAVDTTSDVVLLGTSAGLLRSVDHGESWEVAQAGLEDLTVFDLALHPTGILIAATSGGIRRSTDGGRSWA